METLENELKLLISKVKNADNFCSEIENIQNVYPFNQQPRRKRRGTMLNVSHCMFYKVVAVGFNTLCYDAERRVLNPPHE